MSRQVTILLFTSIAFCFEPAIAGVLSFSPIQGRVGVASSVNAISRNGHVVAGADDLGPVRWIDFASPPQALTSGPNTGAIESIGVNVDGSVIVGSAAFTGQSRPARWMELGGTRALMPTGAFSVGQAFVVSDDGGVIAGRSGNSAFRWTRSEGGVVLADATAPFATPLDVFAMSADGSIIAGSARRLNGSLAASVTTGSSTLQLPSAGGEFPDANVWTMSPDGSTFVGADRAKGLGHVAIWRTGEPEYLPRQNPGASLVSRVVASSDASVVTWVDGNQCVLWTADGGLVVLRDILGCHGYFNELSLYADPLKPVGISGDGSILVGNGYRWDLGRNVAWVIRLSRCPADLNGDGLVDDADFSLFVVSYDIFLDVAGDFTLDCVTDDRDFSVFAKAYDQLICP
jgi:hypothetical protein